MLYTILVETHGFQFPDREVWNLSSLLWTCFFPPSPEGAKISLLSLLPWAPKQSLKKSHFKERCGEWWCRAGSEGWGSEKVWGYRATMMRNSLPALKTPFVMSPLEPGSLLNVRCPIQRVRALWEWPWHCSMHHISG